MLRHIIIYSMRYITTAWSTWKEKAHIRYSREKIKDPPLLSPWPPFTKKTTQIIFMKGLKTIFEDRSLYAACRASWIAQIGTFCPPLGSPLSHSNTLARSSAISCHFSMKTTAASRKQRSQLSSTPANMFTAFSPSLRFKSAIGHFCLALFAALHSILSAMTFFYRPRCY